MLIAYCLRNQIVVHDSLLSPLFIAGQRHSLQNVSVIPQDPCHWHVQLLTISLRLLVFQIRVSLVLNSCSLDILAQSLGVAVIGWLLLWAGLRIVLGIVEGEEVGVLCAHRELLLILVLTLLLLQRNLQYLRLLDLLSGLSGLLLQNLALPAESVVKVGDCLKLILDWDDAHVYVLLRHRVQVLLGSEDVLDFRHLHYLWLSLLGLHSEVYRRCLICCLVGSLIKGNGVLVFSEQILKHVLLLSVLHHQIIGKGVVLSLVLVLTWLSISDLLNELVWVLLDGLQIKLSLVVLETLLIVVSESLFRLNCLVNSVLRQILLLKLGIHVLVLVSLLLLQRQSKVTTVLLLRK